MSATLDLSPGSSFARYRIVGLLGRGGMGAVYRATDPDQQHDVALKLILPDLLGEGVYAERFAREARLTAQVDSPHAIPLHESGVHDGVPYLATRFVEGSDLETLLCEGPLHPAHAGAVTAHVASALDAAHAEGLVHRDVKPGNVMLERRDHGAHAYLTDFGLARHRASQSGLTRTGMWVGSVDYAAPEQVQAGDVDGRADVYALGCVLHEMLTGQVPFPRDREVSKLMAHVSEPPPRPSDVDFGLPDAFDGVVAQALAKRPEERFISAGELGEAALAAAAGAGQPSRPLLPGNDPERREPADPSAPTVA